MGFLNPFSVIGRFLVAAAFALVAVAVALSGDVRLVLLVVAASVLVPGLALLGIGARLGRVSMLSARLRSSGEVGTATVRSVRDLRIRVNGAPVLEIGLDVQVFSHGSYPVSIRQTVPAGRPIVIGDRVGVVVDPTERENLAIDWDVVPESPVPESEETPEESAQDAGFLDAEHLLRVGRPAKAVIISMRDAGDMSELGLVEVGDPGDDDRMFIVDMEVQQAGMDPYEVRVAHRVPERLLGRVGPRTRVRVAVDRQDDHAVAIDWDSVGR